MKFKYILSCLFILFITSTYSQLSDLHYLPPLKQNRNNQAIQQQAIYLSTPNSTAFNVHVYQGTNTTPITTFSLSKTTPITYTLGNGDNNITLVTNTNTGVILSNSGLKFEAPSGEKFYVNYRGRSNSQATSLTSKGRPALGQNFRWGGPPIRANHNTMSSSLGIMATENNTVVDIFGYDTNCEFRLQSDADGITANTIQITLSAGESFVLEAIKNQATANIDGWLGATITSNKDIAISNGALNFGVRSTSASRDAGIDQPVPTNSIGREYVFVRGNGNNENEFPLIIGTHDNTDVFINGSTTPIATINNGEYVEIPGSHYSGTSRGHNMLVTTSKDSYAYQVTSGASGIHTVGLNFIAPVNCLLPDTMDHISDIRDIAGINATGGISLIASTSTPNANIIVTDNTGVVTLLNPIPVTGTADWKTFFISGLNGNVTIESTGPIAVGFLGFNGARGIAGYFSGFDTVPDVNLEITGKNCLPGSEIKIIGGEFDNYQWYINGTEIIGANSKTYIPIKPGDYYVEVTKGSCSYPSNIIHANICTIITNRRITYRVKQ